MHIALTDSSTGQPLLISAQTILVCRKDAKDRLTTLVMTGISGPGGLQAYRVEESPEEVGRRILAAFQWNMTGQPTPPFEAMGFGKCGGPDTNRPSVSIIRN